MDKGNILIYQSDQGNMNIDQAIAKAAKEVVLIEEYKHAMIAAAVLGKLNHRIIGRCSEIPNSSKPSQRVHDINKEKHHPIT